MSLPLYEYGQAVRLIRNVRNDGTYPGSDTGALLMRRGGWVASTTSAPTCRIS